MKTIMDEAIDAFKMNHDDRCLDYKSCNHRELVKRLKDYENELISSRINMADDLIIRIKSVRDGWLDKPNIREGSYAAFIEHIFSVAIKFLEEVK